MPPAVGDALYLGFEAPLERLRAARGRGLLPGPRRRRRPRGPAAQVGGLVRRGARRLRPGRPCWRTPPAASTTAAASSSCRSRRPHDAATGRRGRGRFWLRCRLDDTTRGRARRRPPSPTRPEIYSITAAAARRAGPRGAQRPGGRGGDRRERRHAGPDLPRSATPPCWRSRAARTWRCSSPSPRAWRAWELRESFAESGPTDPHYPLDLRQRRGAASARRSAPATGPGGSTGWCRRRARGCGWPATATAAGAAATSRRGALTRPEERDPDRRQRRQPGPRRGRRRPREPGGRAPAGRDGDPHPLPGRHRRGLRVPLRARRRPASRAPSASSRPTPSASRGCTWCRAIEPADRRLTLDELTPDEELFGQVGAYLDERRLIGTRVELLPARYRGVSIVVEPPGVAARRPAPRGGGGRPTRSTRTSTRSSAARWTAAGRAGSSAAR